MWVSLQEWAGVPGTGSDVVSMVDGVKGNPVFAAVMDAIVNDDDSSLVKAREVLGSRLPQDGSSAMQYVYVDLMFACKVHPRHIPVLDLLEDVAGEGADGQVAGPGWATLGSA